MRKKFVITAALCLFVTSLASIPLAAAQETAKQSEDQLKPTGSFKVEFMVNEFDNGKKINSRSYSMRLNASTLPQWTVWQQIRVGSRVPLSVEAGKFEYVDIGMDIDCRIMQMGKDYVAVGTRWKYSSTEGERMVSQNTQNPVLRQVRSDTEAVVPLDKSTVISEVDDVASTHRYTFEVKVTKIVQ